MSTTQDNTGVLGGKDVPPHPSEFGSGARHGDDAMQGHSPARIIAKSLGYLRLTLGPSALPGVCAWVISHATETLRRAGQGDEARRILISELGDLELAKASGPVLERRLRLVSNGGQQGDLA